MEKTVTVYRRKPIADLLLDGRSREHKRLREVTAIFLAALQDVANEDPILAEKVHAASELAVVAEITRARFLSGGEATADDVVRTANQAQRAERALGIDARRRPQKPNLRDYLQSKIA